MSIDSHDRGQDHSMTVPAKRPAQGPNPETPPERAPTEPPGPDDVPQGPPEETPTQEPNPDIIPTPQTQPPGTVPGSDEPDVPDRSDPL